jgi:cell division protein FtsL
MHEEKGTMNRRTHEPPAKQERREQERRYIYGGEPRTQAAGYALRTNRRATRRRVSTFNIILILFACGAGIVFYVNNIITVNQLALDVGKLQTRYDTIMNTNAALRAEVSRKSSWERIGGIATEQLGLRYPKEQPVWFDVDRQTLERLEGR